MSTSRTSEDVHSYARRVVAGEVVAGPHVRSACARHLRDLESAHERGLYFSPEAADRALGFFHDILRLSEGQFEGEPFELHESQVFIVGSIFGWMRADGTRRFHRAYIEQGKGNGKSPLAGGLGLYGLTADREPGAQVYAAAAKRDQANILFQDAVKMYQQSPDLLERLRPSGINPVYNLAHMESGSFFRPLGKDTGRTGSGVRPHFVLIDELHEHPDRSTIEMLERGFKFRRQPLLFMITNSGSDRNSVCWEEHESAIAIAAGTEENIEYADTVFSYVCALDEGDDPLEDPSCWIKANPLLGVTITEKYLQDVVSQARAIPGRANSILRLHFCVWTDAETAWIGDSTFMACVDPEMTMEEFEGQECWVGLDLSATKDLTSASLVFRDGITPRGDPKFALFSMSWTPQETLLEREKVDKTPYALWVEEGHLIATPGKLIRYDHVAHDLVDLSTRFVFMMIAYDRHLIKRFEEALDELGADLPLQDHPQSVNRRRDTDLWMPDSINMFEQLILERRLRVGLSPVLRSAVAAATFWTSPAGLRRFEKSRSTRRIDPCQASAMAIGAATGAPVEEKRERKYQMMVF